MNDYFDLPDGSQLYLVPISEADLQGIILSVRREFEAAGRPVDPPTYLTAAEETFEWDKESVERDGSEEDKAIFSDHEKVLQEINNEQESRAVYYILTEGTSKLVTPNGGEIGLVIDVLTGDWQPPVAWLKHKQRTGYVLPDDGYDCKFDFLRSVVKGISPIRAITARCVALGLRGAVDEEGIAKFEATFRRAMAQAGRQAAARFDAALEGISDLAEEAK